MKSLRNSTAAGSIRWAVVYKLRMVLEKFSKYVNLNKQLHMEHIHQKKKKRQKKHMEQTFSSRGIEKVL